MENIRVIPQKTELVKIVKVAAYARVSTAKDSMLQSLSAQVSYYSDLIQKHKGWSYVGVYSDEGISGTKDDRIGFTKMVEDAKAGKIDLIITKSISRFARNTVTLLETVRELKQHGVDIYFEEQKINSVSSDGELLLTILASYAQEESRSVSENMKWRIKKNFEGGIPWGAKTYGYVFKNNHFVIVPDEAEIVKRIFDLFLSGVGFYGILRILNKEGILTRGGYKWCQSSIRTIITNHDYTGNMILQKTYTLDFITKKSVNNNGEVTKYYAENTHEAIIPLEIFYIAQDELKRRADKVKPKEVIVENPFSKIIVCGKCNKAYLRKQSQHRTYYICTTFARHKKDACDAKQIAEQELIRVTNEVLGTFEFNEAILKQWIKQIKVFNNTIVFIFHNGTEKLMSWNTLSRKDSWTPEMKEQARKRECERWQKLQ